MEDESFEKGVHSAGQEAKWAREKDERHDGAMFGFKSFEQRHKGDGVEDIVKDVSVKERVGV